MNGDFFYIPFLPLSQCNYKHWVFSALEWSVSVKYADSFRKMYLEEFSCKEGSLQENRLF